MLTFVSRSDSVKIFKDCFFRAFKEFNFYRSIVIKEPKNNSEAFKWFSEHFVDHLGHI